ncbi:MAG: 1-acyl-sn-glycerol-3-phosphate acyltransferase [Flavisolibacter sp.]|nr:1-acyl-sn-glycerol-3-phosphate acyltransferase [Flavisolibacter sp.]
MLFQLVKLYARLCIKIYCRKIIINNPGYLKAKGPLLFAANHPNSFLDGVILTTLLEENLYSLARGDAFKKPWHKKILLWVHQLPVYRTSEGVENLGHNYTTFKACQDVFRNNGIVMIFSEGRCINEWHLRPLKKGTARLAISTWLKGIDLTVVPVGFNYSSFRNFGKNVFINFGEPLNQQLVLDHVSDGKQFFYFNEQLKNQLEVLVYEIDAADKEKLKETFYVNQPALKKILLAIPALAGFIIHAPLYFSVKTITKKYFDNDHFDSVVASLLMLAYLIYLPLLCIIVSFMCRWEAGVAGLIVIPFTAWACVQLKKQID